MRQGHEVRRLHPRDGARYRTGNKTDRVDTKALLEAGRNGQLRAVPVKSLEALVALHRLRQDYLRTRTARITPCAGTCASSGASSRSARSTCCHAPARRWQSGGARTPEAGAPGGARRDRGRLW